MPENGEPGSKSCRRAEGALSRGYANAPYLRSGSRQHSLTIGAADIPAESWAEPADGVIIDFDRDRNPISVEIQNASRRYPAAALNPINIGQAVSLAQLATEFNLAEAHLRKLAITGRLGATKIGRNWAATRAAVEDYLDRTSSGVSG